MGLWCKDLPFVEVPTSDTPKPVTLIVPYYEQPIFFARQLAHWASYPSDLAAYLSIIVVDDGSPTQPASTVPRPALRDVRLFRITPDIRWNWLAARNIGLHHAADGWCLVTDMDHVVPSGTLRACITGQHDPRVAYAFSRQEHTGAPAMPHSASFFLTRQMFWTTGGYDEALSGHYGTDGDFRRRLAIYAKLAVLSQPLIRHEYVEDSSTTKYLRKQPEDAAVRRLVARRGIGWQPKVLSFPYTEVTSC